MYQKVTDSYEGQSVFMTGGTGFLGKVLLEKLLYSWPGIKKVYLLVREKHNATAQQRIQKMFDEPLFTRLRNESPQALEKLVPIVGDISEPKLAIKAEDEKLLSEENILWWFLLASETRQLFQTRTLNSEDKRFFPVVEMT